jgi:hypothetical protein
MVNETIAYPTQIFVFYGKVKNIIEVYKLVFAGDINKGM